ncbi:MAG TPA: hypothetical protein VIV11_07565 [Kofleriaceae bacterium]
MTWRIGIAAVGVTAACHSSAPIPSNRTAPPTTTVAESSPLPAGVVEDCFLPAKCDATGDLDADRLPDRVVLVARADVRGLAVFWGSGATPTLIGAGAKLRVVAYGDTEADTPRSAGTQEDYETDLSEIEDWDVLKAVAGRNGRKALRTARGGAFDFVPAVHGDAIRISGSDAAEVLYRTADGTWFQVPLGY